MYMYLNTDSFKKHSNFCKREWFNHRVLSLNVGGKYAFDKRRFDSYRYFFKGIGHICGGRYVKPFSNMFNKGGRFL